MSTLVEIECPHCQASLKLKSRQPLGKKVPCPKCRKPFVAKEKVAAAAPPPVSSAVDDYDDYDAAPVKTRDPFDDAFGGIGADEGFDDLAPAPSETRRKKKPKKKGMPAGLKWSLIGGGAVFGLAVVGIAMWLVIGMYFKKLDLAWLPPDANNIGVVRVSEIWKSEIVQDSLNGDTKDAISKMKKDYGIEPQDIESVTRASDGSDRLTIVRTHIDMDPETIIKNASDHEEASYGGADYYRMGRNALYFPDKRTAISGPEDSVKKAIDRGPEAQKRDDLKFVDAGYQVLKIHVKSREQREREAKLSGEIMGIPIGKTIATCEGTSYTSSIKTKRQEKFASVEDAKEYEEKAKKLQEEFQEKLKDFDKNELYKRLSDEEKKEFEEAANSVSFSSSRSGDTINTVMSFTPTKRMREKRRGSIFGLGDGASVQISSLAREPRILFNIPLFSQPRIINRNLGVNIPRPNPGINRGARVTVFDITVGNGRNGDEEAAKAVINGVNGIDAGRTTAINGRLRAYSKPGDNVRSSQIIAALRAAGFQSYRVNSRTE